MTVECSYTIEKDTAGGFEDKVVVKRDSVLTTVLCRISQFWPVRLTMRAFRGFWLLLGFSPSEEKSSAAPEDGDCTSPARQCLAGRKRLSRVSRILLAILPRRMQRALGYPVCTSIGCSVSPEVRVSPTKPCGKGNKRKQDDLDDDDEDDEDEQTWVEALTQELADDDAPSVDPDFEPSAVETDSEEYNSHNDTESDIEVSEKGVVVIEDVKTDIP
ncbi:oogenesis-related isoform X2 [Esox lucius]|uniref:oogenesis-related isoform X2 n=1 Tax=Esox lucius TaxID=8010 RepID=UPI0014768F12|nr:oogenesis-related isoform X2 [Esox lucius]